MGHHPEEHQAEQGQSEVLELDNPMEVSSGECSSWTFFQTAEEGDCRAAGGESRRDDFREMTSESLEASGSGSGSVILALPQAKVKAW